MYTITRTETERMLYFLFRTPMYVGEVNKEAVVSFMHGADFGKRKEPFWTTMLKEFIETKYKIYGSAIGWPYQIEQFCERKGVVWFEGFKYLMVELIKESEQIQFTKQLQSLKQKLEEH